MKTKYWNEYTNEVFDTEEEAVASEKKYLAAQEAKKKAEEERIAAKKKKDSERAIRAKEVQEALTIAVKARKDYQVKLSNFCKDYGPFHFSTEDIKELEPFSIFDFIENWM
jgi:hypothetical protein